MAVKGMGGQLTRPQAKRSGLVAAMQRNGAEHEQAVVPLAELAENPANPAARATDDLADLAESIREVGIVQALTVVPAVDWLQHHPEHQPAVGEARYVLVAGHRRRAAGLLAGQTHAPVMVRPDLARVGVADVQLHENLHRLALTPLQEARAYAAKVGEGFSQRQIAAAVKVSQGQIAKRLSLLQLPEPLQVAVDQGWYTVADALQVLKHEQDVIDEIGQRVSEMTAAENELVREEVDAEADLSHAEALASRARTAAGNHRMRLSSITSESLSAVTARKRRVAAEARAQELGAQLIDNPGQKFHGKEWSHEVTVAREVERHAKKGNLAVAPAASWSANDEPRYYALAKDNPKQQVADQAAQERQAAERREKKGRSAGHKARVAALVQLATKKPAAAELREHLVLHVLDAPTYDYRAKNLARTIAIEAGMGPSDTTAGWDWMKAAAEEQDPAKRELLAWILIWAAREQQHQDDTSHGGWNARSIKYFEDLQETGYEPGEWEQEQLANARRRVAELTARSDEEPADDEDAMEGNE